MVQEVYDLILRVTGSDIPSLIALFSS